jgi:16S rRNA (adenine1518-N6/adenine1519-N6)-dimethyltransferase
MSSNYLGIEYDQSLYNKLSTKYRKNINVNFINEDAGLLSTDTLKSFFKSQYILVGNLPYYASNKIVRNFISSDFKPKNLIIMVQKEVADSYLCKPPKMKFLSNSIQIYADIELIVNVDPESFDPMPNVKSSVICLNLKPFDMIPKNPEKIINTIKNGFDSPRKKIRNSFTGIKKDKIEKILIDLNLDLNLRPGNLTLENWEQIHNSINNEN